eukprot:g37000.t1
MSVLRWLLEMETERSRNGKEISEMVQVNLRLGVKDVSKVDELFKLLMGARGSTDTDIDVTEEEMMVRAGVMIKGRVGGGVRELAPGLDDARPQLYDISSYLPLDYEPTSDHQTIVSQSIHNLITSGGFPPTASNLIVLQPRTARFYFLSKIHKPDCPGRPIVCACSCPTELISAQPDPSTDTLISLMELVLTLKSFSFNSSHCLQTKGVTIGTCMCSNYAYLFVEQSLFRCSTGTIPHLFLRYIDDCISAASCSHEELEQFINFTNIFHPNLKFTWTICDTCLSFLDLSISIS